MVTKVVHENQSDNHSMCNQSHTRLSVFLYYSTSSLPCLEHSETHTHSDILSDTLTRLHTMPNACSHCTFCCFLFWKISQTKYQPVCLTQWLTLWQLISFHMYTDLNWKNNRNYWSVQTLSGNGLWRTEPSKRQDGCSVELIMEVKKLSVQLRIIDWP